MKRFIQEYFKKSWGRGAVALWASLLIFQADPVLSIPSLTGDYSAVAGYQESPEEIGYYGTGPTRFLCSVETDEMSLSSDESPDFCSASSHQPRPLSSRGAQTIGLGSLVSVPASTDRNSLETNPGAPTVRSRRLIGKLQVRPPSPPARSTPIFLRNSSFLI
jgi:hypothetical protein